MSRERTAEVDGERVAKHRKELWVVVGKGTRPETEEVAKQINRLQSNLHYHTERSYVTRGRAIYIVT